MAIKILGICGSPIKGGNAEAFLREALTAAEQTGDVTTKLVSLAGKEIQNCRHCNWCIRKEEAGKFCNINDGMVEIYPEVLNADALMVSTPVYTGRLSGYTASFLDRLRPLNLGKVSKGKLKNKVGAALAVAWARNCGIEPALLDITLSYFAREMIAVGPPAFSGGSHLGAAGLSSEGGTGKFDPSDRLGVLRDEYGVKGARALGRRVAEITKLLHKAKQS